MLIPVLLLLAGLVPDPAADPAGVEIVAFRPESRTLAPGAEAVSEVVVGNAGSAARTVWIGYSVQDPNGRWHDVPAHAVTIPARGEAPPQRKTWRVPDGDEAGGSYRVVMAVWSGPPGGAEAVRLASVDRASAFRVRDARPRLEDEPAGAWTAGSHRLGRGLLRPDQVRVDGDGFRLGLLPGRCEGAEVRSRARVHFGEYAARLKVPDAPGSLSAFFLYESVDEGNDEIDIEIFNDGSRRALLTAWRDGEATRETEVVLPFDPAADFHDYVIRWSEREVVFLADGAVLGRWDSGFPQRPMHVMVNVWWPTWLPCTPPPTPRALEVDWIRLDEAP